MVAPSPDTRPSKPTCRQVRSAIGPIIKHTMRNGSPRAVRILRWVIRLGTGAFSLALLLPALALRSLTREVQEVAAGDLLVYATGDHAGLPVDVAAIEPVTAVQVFPQGQSDNERNLVRTRSRSGQTCRRGLSPTAPSAPTSAVQSCRS